MWTVASPWTARDPVARVIGDDWAQLCAVDDFNRCVAADLIRVFPRLLPCGDGVPAAVEERILRVLAVLAWRATMRRCDEAVVEVLGDMPKAAIGALLRLGAQDHAQWFAHAPGAPGRLGPFAGRTAWPEETECLALAGALRGEIASGRLRPFEPASAAFAAFVTGLHAAYLWPEALISHELFTAAGWLGQLWRQGRADMTHDLADYFDDVITGAEGGPPRLREPLLAPLLPATLLLDLRRAIAARRRGFAAIVVVPGGRASGSRAAEPASEGRAR